MHCYWYILHYKYEHFNRAVLLGYLVPTRAGERSALNHGLGKRCGEGNVANIYPSNHYIRTRRLMRHVEHSTFAAPLQYCLLVSLTSSRLGHVVACGQAHRLTPTHVCSTI